MVWRQRLAVGSRHAGAKLSAQEVPPPNSLATYASNLTRFIVQNPNSACWLARSRATLAAPSAVAKLVSARSPNISTSLIWQVHELPPWKWRRCPCQRH